MSAIGDIGLSAEPASGWRGQGFTLIETLVIIGLLALISALAFPRVERILDGANFASARMMVVGAAAEARGAAIRSDSSAVLTVSTDGANLLINNASVARLPSGVLISPIPRPIIYYSDGSASGGDLVLVGGRRRVALAVASETGLSRWTQ